MAGTDIVFLYRDSRTGEAYFAVRDFAEDWYRAGAPSGNSFGRLFGVQLAARLAFENGTGSPADDPRRPDLYELAHCRFCAGDIDATPARVAALSAVGLVRPFSYESWHWRRRNLYDYPIITFIPASAANASQPFTPVPIALPIEEDDDMTLYLEIGMPAGNKHRVAIERGLLRHFIPTDPADKMRDLDRARDDWQPITLAHWNVMTRTKGIDDNAWRFSADGRTMEVLNPLTGQYGSGNVWMIENARYADEKRERGGAVVAPPAVPPTSPEVVTPPK